MSDLPIIDAQAPKPVTDAPVLAPGDTALARQPGDDEAQDGNEAEGQQTPEEKAAAEEAKEADKLRKKLEKQQSKIDMLFAQRQEARERAHALEQRLLQPRAIDDINGAGADDSDRVSLSRAELQQMIEREAKQLAPKIKEQQDEIEQRKSAARSLLQELGPDRYQEYTDTLADFLPAQSQLLILETESPRALIEYLNDPENEDELKAISRLSLEKQGLKLGLLAAQLKAKRSRDKKPEPSKAPQPLEPVKSQGDASRKPLALLSDKEFAERRRQQIAARR
jgi:hypothetical protein